MRRRPAIGLAVLAVAALGGCSRETSDPERDVAIDIEHSRFGPERLTLEVGSQVRFVVRNDDPIDHELIVGPDEVHERHEDGTEAEHSSVPGEVSVPAGETRTTTYRFDEPGTVVYACHLPGHLAFGMRGEIEVVAAT